MPATVTVLAEFGANVLSSDTVLPTGPFGVAALGDLDFSTGTKSIDPNTREIVIEGAHVLLAPLAANVLNSTFPNTTAGRGGGGGGIRTPGPGGPGQQLSRLPQ